MIGTARNIATSPQNFRRIFIAIPISENLQREILEWEENFKNLPVRWLQGKNLHITLVPPWYTDEVEKIKEACRNFKKISQSISYHPIEQSDIVSPFEIEFRKVTYGPDPQRPRLIWAEGKTPAEIRNLKLEIERALNQKPEERQFKLHLTLARFGPRPLRQRSGAGGSETFSSFPIKKLDEKVDWKERVESFVIMESHLSPEGADYEVLEKIVL
jgi:2'-5' RNA ligase